MPFARRSVALFLLRGSRWSWMKTAVMGEWLDSFLILFMVRYSFPFASVEFIFLDRNLGPGCGSIPSSVRSRNHSHARSHGSWCRSRSFLFRLLPSCTPRGRLLRVICVPAASCSSLLPLSLWSLVLCVLRSCDPLGNSILFSLCMLSLLSLLLSLFMAGGQDVACSAILAFMWALWALYCALCWALSGRFPL